MCAWFDAYSLDNIHERQELQKDGIRESVLHILDILEEEARLLDRFSHIYLGGMSQGMATALWAFLAATATGRIQVPLGGLLGFCGWLPFSQQLEQLLSDPSFSPGSSQAQGLISGFYFDEIAEISCSDQPVHNSVLSTPVFLSHGSDDPWVSVELGRQACQVLRRLMVRVDWQEFTGAEGDGHWVKEPEGFDHILKFLEG
jgi:predicted esterase